jgi:hypothetical protein
MKCVDPTKPYRKSGGMGHPGICCAAEDKKCPVSYPAGRLRRWTTLRKAAHAALSTAAQQESGYALSRNISKKGPRNCRSLGYARDDKGEAALP